MEDILSKLPDSWQNILTIVGCVWIGATAIAAITPSGKDNTFLQKVGKFFDKIGFDVKGLMKK